ncbi:MAG: hypothetical protein ABIP89_10705 [Polyangiaceae bacterium]
MSRAFWVSSVFALATVACGSTIDVGQNDGGPNGDGGGGDAAASSDGGTGSMVSDAASSSSYFAKCTLACTPTERPCLSQDVNACIETCTTFTDGLALACAQCVIEHSGYDGVICDPSCTAAPCATCNFSAGTDNSCVGNGSATGMPCPGCLAADERCSGFKLTKTTDSACASLCK